MSMKPLVETVEYRAFAQHVPRRKMALGKDGLSWDYYDCGDRESTIPLVCLHDVSGTAELFYKQVLSLSAHGLRVVSVQLPALSTTADFVSAFGAFLDDMAFDRVSLLGLSLGGFLAQIYAHAHPHRVSSLILVNSFSDTSFFRSSCSMGFSWAPEFLLKRMLLMQLPQGDLEPEVALSVDFVVEQLESLSQWDLAARLYMHTEAVVMKPTFPDAAIMIMETLDEKAIPESAGTQLVELYPKARVASLKVGGNFPNLANAGEFNMHILIHFRAQATTEEINLPGEAAGRLGRLQGINAEGDGAWENVRGKMERDDGSEGGESASGRWHGGGSSVFKSLASGPSWGLTSTTSTPTEGGEGGGRLENEPAGLKGVGYWGNSLSSVPGGPVASFSRSTLGNTSAIPAREVWAPESVGIIDDDGTSTAW